MSSTNEVSTKSVFEKRSSVEEEPVAPSSVGPSSLGTAQSLASLAPPETDDEFSAQAVDDWAEDMGDGPRQVCWQSLLPLLIGGLGSILAGIILNFSIQLQLIKKIPQFVAVMPPIQGMKGNLDMTFTSRLTTMAHKGELDAVDGKWTRIFRHICLMEGQAIIFSNIVMAMSFLIDLPRRRPFGCAYNTFFFLDSVALCSVTVSCFFMTLTMVGIVFVARKYRLNPDNMATPFVSSLGDLLSLGLMLGFSYGLYATIEQSGIYVSYILIGMMFLSIPGWFYGALKDKEAHMAAKYQWCTLILAAFIASGAGALLEWASERFPDITAYQPLISGIAGNRAALLASRLSTNLNLHKVSYIPFASRINPFSYFITSRSKETRTARMLLLTSTFFQLFFVLITHLISKTYKELHFSTIFMLGYLLAAFFQVFLLIYLAQLIVTFLWKSGVDPDIHAIPLITAAGDVLGTSLLVGLFFALAAIAHDAVRIELTEIDTITTTNCTVF